MKNEYGKCRMILNVTPIVETSARKVAENSTFSRLSYAKYSSPLKSLGFLLV